MTPLKGRWRGRQCQGLRNTRSSRPTRTLIITLDALLSTFSHPIFCFHFRCPSHHSLSVPASVFFAFLCSSTRAFLH